MIILFFLDRTLRRLDVDVQHVDHIRPHDASRISALACSTWSLSGGHFAKIFVIRVLSLLTK